MGRVFAWLDTGIHDSLLDAGNFVRTLERRQRLQTGNREEVSFEMGWIEAADLHAQADKFRKNRYGAYLRELARDAQIGLR
jgi:glucose-1-phosphate thymidylyltransferase